MSKDDTLTDEYVAGLLAADAKQSTIKYSAMGLEAFAPSKPPANKPKPNTRFLRNIIKDTDSHNATLLAKEAAESKARLHELASNGERSERLKPVNGGDIRRRQLGDIAAILGGGPRKHKRVENDSEAVIGRGRKREVFGQEGRPERLTDERRKHRNKDELDRKDGSSGKHRSQRRRRERSASSEDREETRGRQRRDRSRSPKRERKGDDRRHRERSPRRRRSRSPEDRKQSSRSQQRRSSLERYDPKQKKTARPAASKPQIEDDSDPLDDIIGPKPPSEVRSRGRGAVSAASGMDSRFSKGYNPSADVQLDFDEGNDWDQALEALRDRQKWKQQGAERLRAAGFTDDEVKKWEKGGEKCEEDVKWSKTGEGREWDRGKVINDEGIVTFDPTYGRLRDS